MPVHVGFALVLKYLKSQIIYATVFAPKLDFYGLSGPTVFKLVTSGINVMKSLGADYDTFVAVVFRIANPVL